MSTTTGRIGKLTGLTAAAVAVAATAAAWYPSPAYAAGAPALQSTLAQPAPVTSGGTGKLDYSITNTLNTPTDGVLMNVSLPKYVSIPADPHCQKTGTTPDGGTTVSCNFSDAMGKLAPHQRRTAATPFTVAREAPARRPLGRIGVLVVPLKDGKPTEDWHNVKGRNVSSTTIFSA